MTPQEYLQRNKPLFCFIRYALFYSVPLMDAAYTKTDGAFRDAPMWAIAMAASARLKHSKDAAVQDVMETMVWMAGKEFSRRMKFQQCWGSVKP